MATTIATAITNLLTVVDAALTDVTVHDGPPVTAETKEWVAVGFDPASDSAVDFDREWRTLAGPQLKQEESYDILCTLAVWSGDTDITAGRARAFELLDDITLAVASNPTLSGAVRLAAVLGNGSLIQVQDDRGGSVGLRFRVNCQARITTTV